MAKYLFHELNKDRAIALPEDVNEPIESAAQRFGDADWMKLLKDAREKRLYGTAKHALSDGRVIMEVEFQNGMCPRMKLVQWYGNNNLFSRSVRNKNLDMEKPKKKA